MQTPFSWLSPDLQGNVLIALSVLSLTLMKMLSEIGRDLTIRNEHIPFGIINLEFPWTEERAASIVKVWSGRGLVGKAVQQTELDFILLLLYPAALSLAGTMVVGSGDGPLAAAVSFFSWAVLLCTPLDAFENLMILRMLSGSSASPVPQLTTISAGLKFLLVASSVVSMLSMLALKALR
jgi:hypothetical protein